MGEAAVAERCRHRAAIERHLAHDVVEFAGGDAGADVVDHRIEDFGGEPPGAAHAFEAFGAVELDRAVAQHKLAVDHCLVFGHGAHVATKRRNCDPLKPLSFRGGVGVGAIK